MKLQSRAWLTSFGDLLTLLLCFIIAAVYQSAKDIKQKNQSIQVDSLIVNSRDRAVEASGKQIASNLVTEYPHRALSLLKVDFEPSYASLSKKGINKIRDFAEGTEGILEIGICNVGFDYSDTAFETLGTQFVGREIKWTVGSEVCMNLKELEQREETDTILLSANVKQSHG